MTPCHLSRVLWWLSLLPFVCAVALQHTGDSHTHLGWVSPAFAALSIMLNILGSWIQRRHEQKERQLQLSYRLSKHFASSKTWES